MFCIIVSCSPTFPRSISISDQPGLRAPNPHSSLPDAPPICFPPRYSIATSRFHPSSSLPRLLGCSGSVRPPASRASCFSALAHEVCISAFFRPLTFFSPLGRIAAKHHIALGIPLRFSNSGTLRSQGYPQVLFEPHLNSHRAIAQGGIQPPLRMSARRTRRPGVSKISSPRLGTLSRSWGYHPRFCRSAAEIPLQREGHRPHA